METASRRWYEIEILPQHWQIQSSLLSKHPDI
jgi:hypothetical protein